MSTGASLRLKDLSKLSLISSSLAWDGLKLSQVISENSQGAFFLFSLVAYFPCLPRHCLLHLYQFACLTQSLHQFLQSQMSHRNTSSCMSLETWEGAGNHCRARPKLSGLFAGSYFSFSLLWLPILPLSLPCLMHTSLTSFLCSWSLASQTWQFIHVLFWKEKNKLKTTQGSPQKLFCK